MKQNPHPPHWYERLKKYENAFGQLKVAVLLAAERQLSQLEKLGVVQGFKVTHELAWNVMKDYFFDQGNPNITGSRDAVREAFNRELIMDGKYWMEMIKSRNQVSHTYDHEVVNDIVIKVINVCCHSFELFLLKMQSLIHHN